MDDLTDWRYEGVSYRRDQDPSNIKDILQLWAPDVTKGPDGRTAPVYPLSNNHGGIVQIGERFYIGVDGCKGGWIAKAG